MPSFTPESFLEMTVYFEYTAGERKTWDDPGVEEEFTFYEIEINDKKVGPDLEEHLIETFSEDWEIELKELRFEGDIYGDE